MLVKINAKKLFLTAFIFLLSAGAYAREYNGKGLYLLGDSAAALGRGGTGVSSEGVELFYMNPASIAQLERAGLSLQYGDLAGRFHNPDITLAFPTIWGNIGMSFRYLSFPDNKSGMDSGMAFSAGLAKELAGRLMFGMAGSMLRGYGGNGFLFAGGSLGLIYNFDGMKGQSGFGLFKPSAGLSTTAGFPIGGGNMNNLTFGYNLTFYRNAGFDLGFYNDISFLNFYRDFPVKAGLQSRVFKHFIARTGAILGNGYDFAAFTAGAGYVFDKVLTDDAAFSASLNYSFAYDKKSKLVHYAGLTVEYGQLDRDSPSIKIQPDQKYISPNHDGIQDYVAFKLDVKDKSRVKLWSLKIVSPDGDVVRLFGPDERSAARNRSFADLVKKIFSRKTFFDVPESIIWDGTDSKGDIVKDGKYTYIFTASDERDNEAVKTGAVVVDNTPPEITLIADDLLFSPNGDGNKDTLIIKQKIVSEPDDKWEAMFTDAGQDVPMPMRGRKSHSAPASKGKPVKKYAWDGASVPGLLEWDGRDDNGDEVPEGLYRYSITVSDLAGNRAFAETGEITLTREYQNVDIRLEKTHISYRKNPDIRFYPSASDQTGLMSYKISVLNASKKPVYEINGEGGLPKVVSWDGLAADGSELKDGIYYVRLQTVFNSGNTPASFDHRLVIDSAPPKVKISHEPELFSPDGDGVNDLLTIKPSVVEEFGIMEWVIEIKTASGVLFKKFTGSGNPPAEIKWDGTGDNKETVESAVDYEMTLYAVDMAGNSAKTGIDLISVDILVIVTERGLKMRISNIQFSFDSDKLQKQGTQVLDRVCAILERYGNYNVTIEGHTDDIGEEEYNRSLSERRAGAVLEYIVSKGIKRERLKSTGLGKSVPLYPNINEENRRKNRRVEFLLIKMEQS
ncbi:MAG: OmpA family protein [Leptospirales bacterium]|nr:OmpA family protein [Leptospirales bacterium]